MPDGRTHGWFGGVLHFGAELAVLVLHEQLPQVLDGGLIHNIYASNQLTDNYEGWVFLYRIFLLKLNGMVVLNVRFTWLIELVLVPTSMVLLLIYVFCLRLGNLGTN